jgi:N-acetylmuramoyl-L-alanine amidase
MSDIFLSVPSDQLLALTAYGEAAGEGAQGMMAVLNVVLNRIRDLKQFADKTILSQSDAYHAVILKPAQFSAFNPDTPTNPNPVRPKLEALAKTFTASVSSNTALNQAYQLARLAIQGQLSDNTSGATHYHSTSAMPPWSKTMDIIGQLGNHIFYSVYPTWQRVRSTVSEAAEALKPYSIYILIALAGLSGLYYMKRRK